MNDHIVIYRMDKIMPKVASSRREQYMQNRHDQILEAAVRVFGIKGFAGTNVADIAEAANVGKGTLYLYFESKEDIFNSILQERSFLPEMTKLTHSIDGQSIEELLASIAKEYLKNVERSLPIFRLTISEANRFPDKAKQFYYNMVHDMIDTLTQFFISQISAGKMAKLKNPAFAARAFMGIMVTYLMTQRLMGGDTIDQISEDVWVDEIVHVFWKGIEPES